MAHFNFTHTILAAALAAAVLFAPAASAQNDPAPAGEKGIYKFVNKTNGKWKDSEIFWSTDYGKTWHATDKEPTAKCPKGGRIYFSMGAEHPADLGTDWNHYWDFVEFNYGGDTWHINTTYVDAFCIPLTIEVGNNKVGITEPKDKLVQTFLKECPPEWKDCVKGDKWIVAPKFGGFEKGGKHAGFFDQYVDEIWDMYKVKKETPSGQYTGEVVDGALIFTPTAKAAGRVKTYKCASKPSTSDVLLGEGVLGSNPDFCGAFNRHVADDPANFHDKTKFYQTLPYNWYSKFMHDHAIDHKAYGFCYDDAAEQASFFSAKGDAGIVTFYWDEEKK